MTPAIVDIQRRKLTGIQAVWEKCGRLNEGEISFLIRMAGAQLGEPKALHAEDIAWACEIRNRWLKVRPNAVCGGSDAQAVNVFTEALSDLLSLSAIVSAAAQAIEARRAETQSGSACESAVSEAEAPHD